MNVTIKPRTPVVEGQTVLSLPNHGICLPGPHVALCICDGSFVDGSATECGCDCDSYGARCWKWRGPGVEAEIEGVGPIDMLAIVERSEVRWRDFTTMEGRTWDFKRSFVAPGVVAHWEVDLAQRTYLIDYDEWVLIFERMES